MDLFSSSDLISIEATSLTGVFFMLKQQWERGDLTQSLEICMWLDNYMTNCKNRGKNTQSLSYRS